MILEGMKSRDEADERSRADEETNCIFFADDDGLLCLNP